MMRWMTLLTFVGMVLSVAMVVLSAYIRLSDSGVDCQPWPGCFQSSFLSDERPGIAIDEGDTHQSLRIAHRLMASAFGMLMVLIFTITAWTSRRQPGRIVVPGLALIATIVLAVVGMSTPDLAHPLVTTINLSVGMLLAAMMYAYLLSLVGKLAFGHVATLITLVLLYSTIVSGAWVSGNFAAGACNDVLLCSLPDDLSNAFDPDKILLIEEGVIIPDGLETAILAVHQYGGLLTFLMMVAVTIRLGKGSPRRAMIPAGLTLALMIVIGLEQSGQQLMLASLHNGLSLLLLLVLVHQYFNWEKS